MRVIDIVPSSKIVNDLPPEDLAVIVLQCLNSENARSARQSGMSVPHSHLGNFCNGESANYEQAGQPECALALAAAWMHLAATGMIAIDPRSRNDWYCLTARGRSIKTKADTEHFKAAALFPRGVLNPLIDKEAYGEFLRGDYEIAVFKAFRAIEMVVRRAIGAGNEVLGKDLMAKAFNPRDGVLRDEDELVAEQESLMYLYMGAIGRFKNPPSHREVYFTHPSEAVEAIQFASLLMRIANDREAQHLGFTNLDAEDQP